MRTLRGVHILHINLTKCPYVTDIPNLLRFSSRALSLHLHIGARNIGVVPEKLDVDNVQVF